MLLIIIKIILLFFLTLLVESQSQATLTQPSLIQTNTYTLRKISKNITSPTATLTYMQNYTQTPQVFISIVSLNSFTTNSIVNFTINLDTITLTNFIIVYSTSCTTSTANCSFSQIVIDYLAFDFPSYSFVMIAKETLKIDASINLTDQFYKVRYMQHLQNDHNYSLTCMMAGFNNLAITTEPSLYINAHSYNKHYYYLQVQFDNVTVSSLDYIRVLIDDTIMESLNTGPSSLSCDVGVIVHLSDPSQVENNPSPDFLPFAVFFGISGFGGYEVSLTKLSYIFNNTTPRIQASIGYILFLTSSCPANQLYVSSQNLCYGLSSAFYYQATPATLQPCPYSCYQCVGPLTTQCRSCVAGWNRVLSGGRCVCISGFYDPGGSVCKNCTQAISGCKTCSSATNCLTCLSGCTAIGFSPIYCDCPSIIQQNYSYNCPLSYYFDYSINSCSCLPQTYYNPSAKLCFPCDTGCYICAKNASFCLACIDSYQLIDNSCTFFYTSYALVGQQTNYNDPKLRCLRWDQTSGACTQRCKYYYYQQNCYSKCPQGTFNISFPWLTCQPCDNNCLYCYNYTICYQCTSTRYYFNSSILSCSPCTAHCLKCTNASYCSLCENMYELSNGNSTCSMPIIPGPTCEDNCNYCLISYQCLKCKIPYFLNLSDYSCITCSPTKGLILQTNGCQQICGDGISINSECDDGNTNSGDGCSQICQIQNEYQCKLINGTSKCWSRTIAVSWNIYAVFGVNNIIISFGSSFPLANTIIDLQCGFNNSLIGRQTINGKQQVTLNYRQTVLMMHLQESDSNSLLHLAGNITSSQCKVTFNQLHTFTVSLNSDHKFFYVNYGQSIQSINNGKFLQGATTFSVYFILATSILGLSPMSSYSCSRFFLLFFISFIEYMHIPINSFPPYHSLQQMILISPSTTTKQLVIFSSEYYTNILWHLIIVYVAVGIWLEFLVPFGIKVARSMEWTIMVKIGAMIGENKYVTYQNIYISFEVVIWWAILKSLSNAGNSFPILIFLVVLHLLIIVLSKIHFYFTFSYLFKMYPGFTHTMAIEQLENFTIAFVSLATTSKNSYIPIVIILFAIYALLSLGRNSAKSTNNSLSLCLKMILWQIRVTYCCLILFQTMKLLFMWCSNAISSQSQYQAIGTALGTTMGLLVSITMVLGAINVGIVHLILICQAKNQGKATIPSSDTIDMHTVEASSSHAD